MTQASFPAASARGRTGTILSATLQAAGGASAALGTILLDVRGAICRCSDSIVELGRWQHADLLGHPVRALLPELPLHAGTSGYNLAFASFHAQGRRAMPMRIATSSGEAIAVQARMRVMRNDREFQFLLEIERMEEARG
jgi:hypothetical protein